MSEMERMTSQMAALVAQVESLSRSITELGIKLEKVHKRIFEENGQPSLISSDRDQMRRLSLLESQLTTIQQAAQASRSRLRSIGWKLAEVAAVGAMLWVLSTAWEGVIRRVQSQATASPTSSFQP